ncbi:MAG: proton-conducting transporter membrane subunit [Candidatus Coatesbacteria bacterium]
MTPPAPDLVTGLLLAVPLAGAAAAQLARTARGMLMSVVGGAVATCALAAAAVWLVWTGGPVQAAGGWFLLDPLATYHLAVMGLVLLMSSLFAVDYFDDEIRRGALGLPAVRLFAVLWSGSVAAMTLVLVSNSVGLMWVGLEATTLLTAFLICLHRDKGSLEATWKYILICSVGIALAFMGTILVAAAAPRGEFGGAGVLSWTRLVALGPALDPALVRLGFIFLLVGYGTKAGLAPMHTWLPDAHSQAPAPVSALFSGFMINTGLYCLMRYLAILAGTPASGAWARGLLVFLGLVSLVTAAAFILFQRSLKRLLAYSGVEHMGIIALGLGLGGLGTVGALWHVLNHSLAKTFAFCAAGRMGQLYGSHDMDRMKGTLRAAPVWGTGLWVSFLALLGVAPFALFMSEFTIFRGALQARAFWPAGIFLGAVAVVFVGASRHAIAMAFGSSPDRELDERAGVRARVLVWGAIAGLLGLGLWLPGPLARMLAEAARVLEGG